MTKTVRNIRLPTQIANALWGDREKLKASNKRMQEALEKMIEMKEFNVGHEFLQVGYNRALRDCQAIAKQALGDEG